MPGRAAGAHARNLGVAGGGYGFPAGRWQAIKMAFSKRTAAGEALSATRRGRGEHGIWQRRYWEHTIRDNRDYAAHMDYIHFNPVKHGLVTEGRGVAVLVVSQISRNGAFSLCVDRQGRFGG